MSADTYIPEWRTVQRVLDLNSAAGGRELPEPHLPERVRYGDVTRATFPNAKPNLVSHASGCKMHARMILPDPDGTGTTTVCAVCDAPDLFPRISRDLYA